MCIRDRSSYARESTTHSDGISYNTSWKVSSIESVDGETVSYTHLDVYKRQVHGFFLCVAEFEYVEQFFHFRFYVCKFFQRFLVVVGQFALCRYAPVEVFLPDPGGEHPRDRVGLRVLLVVIGERAVPAVSDFRIAGATQKSWLTL